MTIKECIDLVDAQKPNQYSISEKVMWLTFLDKIIINEVLKTHEGYDGRYDDFVGYSEDDLTASLIVESPYDQLYPAYLKMKIDGENGEQTRYNNSAASYNAYMLEFRKNYNKTHMPLGNGAKRNGGVSVKVDVNLSEAEYEAIRRDVYNALSRDVNEITSPDKIYDIVMQYMQSNAERFKGNDGKTPVKGTDYFTEAEVAQIKKDAKGDDGYSPFVEIIPIKGGTRVYITDKNGRKFFDILNGADGKTVTNINQLEGADQYLKKQGGRASVDYGEEGIDVNVNAQRSVTLGAEHVNIIGTYETIFKADQGDIAADFSEQRITNIADPKSEKDGVNKKYVDEALKKISDFEVSVPTRTSDLVNDSGYITVSAIPKVPSKVSQLVNDTGFITLADIPPSGGGGTSGNVPTKLSELENDVGYLKSEEQYGYIGFTNYGKRAFFEAQDDIAIVSESVHILTDGRTVLKSNGDGGVALNVSSQRIANLANPIDDTDGANKKYVDDAVKGIDIPDVSVPTKVSQLENDADYLQNNTDMVITSPHSLEMTSEVVKLEGFYGGSIEIDTEGNVNIAGDAKVQSPVSDTSVANKGYVDGKETAHNTSSTAHNDIRQLISELTSRLNAIADSDDTTLDQLSEIVAYIKANKSLIDSITTSKVNVSDIIDNLTTSVSNKPLSAKMGVELKKLIDAIKIPTTLPASDVYSWAKQPTKPTYTAAEVGAVAKNQGSANVGKILVVGSDGNLMLADMPEGGGDVTGMVDEENNILLSGDLADGTYTLKYANADGTYSDVGTLVVGEIKPSYTNLLPQSVDANGNDFVGSHANGGDGYDFGQRISYSKGTLSAQDGVYYSGFMRATLNDVIRIKGIAAASSETHNVIAFYDESKTIHQGSIYLLEGAGGVSINGDMYTIAPNQSIANEFAFFRFCCGSITDNTIVTVNEEIV